MNDLISRQAALEKVRTMQTYKLFVGDDMILVDKSDVQTELMMLPSVQPGPKKGEWMPRKEGGLCCSECGGYALDVSDGNFIQIAVPSKFCPHCGAKMEGEQKK